MSTLELSVKLRELEEKAASGELTPEFIEDTVEGMEGSISDKLDSLAFLMDKFDSNAALMKKQADQANKRVSHWKSQKDQVRNYAKMIVEASGRQTIKSALHTFSIAKGRQTIRVPDPKRLPDEYYDIVPQYLPRMDEIKAAIKDGEEIEGVEISNAADALRIS